MHPSQTGPLLHQEWSCSNQRCDMLRPRDSLPRQSPTIILSHLYGTSKYLKMIDIDVHTSNAIAIHSIFWLESLGHAWSCSHAQDFWIFWSCTSREYSYQFISVPWLAQKFCEPFKPFPSKNLRRSWKFVLCELPIAARHEAVRPPGLGGFAASVSKEPLPGAFVHHVSSFSWCLVSFVSRNVSHFWASLVLELFWPKWRRSRVHLFAHYKIDMPW